MGLERRLELHEILATLLGSRNVYFQPPNNVQIQYPCIVYKKDDERTIKANNNVYSSTDRYDVTVVDRDPDSEIPDRVKRLPMASFDRRFTADNLHHTTYNLYY